MKILAIIPARGGSKGIPRKNIKMLFGKPLIAYTIGPALKASSIDRVIVSTDDEEIADISRELGAEVMMRSAHLAEDKTPTLPVLQDVVTRLKAEGYNPDAVMTLQPTSPLRTVEHINGAVAQFEADPNADSLVSCIEVPHIFHPQSVMESDERGYLRPYLDEIQPTRRQDKEIIFARNGAAIYVTKTQKLDQYIFGGNLLSFLMALEDSVDIDNLHDFETVNHILQVRGKE